MVSYEFNQTASIANEAQGKITKGQTIQVSSNRRMVVIICLNINMNHLNLTQIYNFRIIAVQLRYRESSARSRIKLVQWKQGLDFEIKKRNTLSLF